MYTLDFPPEVEKSHRQDFANFGEPLPQAMVNKPILNVGLSLYFNAWFELDLERRRDEGETIRRSEVFAYARDYDFNRDQADDLWFYIRKMDAAFFPWYAKRNKVKRGKQSAKVPTTRGKGRRRAG